MRILGCPFSSQVIKLRLTVKWLLSQRTGFVPSPPTLHLSHLTIPHHSASGAARANPATVISSTAIPTFQSYFSLILLIFSASSSSLFISQQWLNKCVCVYIYVHTYTLLSGRSLHVISSCIWFYLAKTWKRILWLLKKMENKILMIYHPLQY